MIPLHKVRMSPEASAAVARVLESGWIAEGPQVQEFECALHAALCNPYDSIVAVNSGTSALQLALELADAEPGTEVVVTPMTCTATICAIMATGARPVWADVDPFTGLIDPDDVAKKLTPRTRAVVAVDYAGRVCNYDHLNTVVAGKAAIIADAAHVFGVSLAAHGQADFVAYSFQAIKYLTTGDGGALRIIGWPRHDVLAQEARRRRWFGLDRNIPEPFINDNTPYPGHKWHMNDIAATIGLANLPLAAESVATQQAIAQKYDKAIEVGTVYLGIPHYAREPHARWLYTVLVMGGADRRDAFVTYMRELGIMAGRAHGRVDRHKAFCFPNGPLPGVATFDDAQVNIPVGWWLSETDQLRIIDAVNNWSRS